MIYFCSLSVHRDVTGFKAPITPIDKKAYKNHVSSIAFKIVIPLLSKGSIFGLFLGSISTTSPTLRKTLVLASKRFGVFMTLIEKMQTVGTKIDKLLLRKKRVVQEMSGCSSGDGRRMIRARSSRSMLRNCRNQVHKQGPILYCLQTSSCSFRPAQCRN